MKSRVFDRKILAGIALSGLVLAMTGCQSGPMPGVLNVGGATPEQPDDRITQDELLAFCPAIALRENTAYYSTYQRNADSDPGKLVYQASITDVTRSCSYEGGMLRMNIAVAGKVVPGPLGSTGSVTLPLRIMVVQGSEVIHEQVHSYDVAVTDIAGATQFVFTDSSFTMPKPTTSAVRAFAGFEKATGE